MKVFYSPEYVGSAYSFETTRKAKWVADSLSSSPISGVELVRPRPLTREQVLQVHSAEYVEAVETGSPRYLAESQGFVWDPGMWPMVLASNGGVVAAALDALDSGLAGSLSSGLHHARYGGGAGFCTFNGLVIAAREAVAAGAQSVLILDLDAHCGGGTASLIARDEPLWQVDVAVDPFDYYPDSVRVESAGRIELALLHRSDEYLTAIRAGLGAVEARRGATASPDAFSRSPLFDLCIYNAGMDPFEGCSTGGMAGITSEVLAEREKIAFAWLRGHSVPTAFVLAGGYLGPGLDAAGLVELHRLTLREAAQTPLSDGARSGAPSTSAGHGGSGR